MVSTSSFFGLSLLSLYCSDRSSLYSSEGSSSLYFSEGSSALYFSVITRNSFVNKILVGEEILASMVFLGGAGTLITIVVRKRSFCVVLTDFIRPFYFKFLIQFSFRKTQRNPNNFMSFHLIPPDLSRLLS